MNEDGKTSTGAPLPTAMLTVAALDVAPSSSSTVYVKESEPWKPAAGVYVMTPVTAWTDVAPCEGPLVTATEVASSVPSESVSFASTLTITAVFTGVEVASAFATGGAFPVVIVKLASDTSKKMLPTASIFTRACVVAIAGKVTACVPSFGVLAARDSGNVAPPSVDRRMLTEAVLIGAAFVPETFQVTVCVPAGRLTAVFGAVTRNGCVAATVTVVSALFTPPVPAWLSRTEARNLTCRPTVGRNSDQQLIAPGSAGHVPVFAFVVFARMLLIRGNVRLGLEVGSNERKSGPLALFTLSSSWRTPASYCSQVYVRASPSVSLPAAVRLKGVRAGIVNGPPTTETVGAVFPLGAGSEVARRSGRRRVGDDLVEAHRVEVVVAERLEVVVPADPGVRHDRRAAAGLHRRGAVAVARARSTRRAERVVRPELVAHLVGDVVDVEGVADGVREPCLGAGLLPGPADDGQPRETAATGREDVADVVVRVADDRVDVGLVLAEQLARVVVGVGVRGRVEVDQAVVVRDELEPDREVTLVDPGDAVHGGDERVVHEGDGAAVERGVLAVGREREPVGAELRADHPSGRLRASAVASALRSVLDEGPVRVRRATSRSSSRTRSDPAGRSGRCTSRRLRDRTCAWNPVRPRSRRTVAEGSSMPWPA